MSWNYRLVRRTHKDGSVTFAIHEAYYDDCGRVQDITQNPVEVFGETVREARRDHAQMAEAFAAPVLRCEDIPEPGAEPLMGPTVPSKRREKKARLPGRVRAGRRKW